MGVEFSGLKKKGKKSKTSDEHEEKSAGGKLKVPHQGCNSEQEEALCDSNLEPQVACSSHSSSLYRELLIGAIDDAICKRAELPVAYQVLTENRTELILKKIKLQKQLCALLEQQHHSDFDNSDSFKAKKRALEEEIEIMEQHIKHCCKNIIEIQTKSENQYSKEKIDRMFDGIRTLDDAKAALAFLFQTAVNHRRSILEKKYVADRMQKKFEQERAEIKKLEDKVKEADYRNKQMDLLIAEQLEKNSKLFEKSTPIKNAKHSNDNPLGMNKKQASINNVDDGKYKINFERTGKNTETK